MLSTLAVPRSASRFNTVLALLDDFVGIPPGGLHHFDLLFNEHLEPLLESTPSVADSAEE